MHTVLGVQLTLLTRGAFECAPSNAMPTVPETHRDRLGAYICSPLDGKGLFGIPALTDIERVIRTPFHRATRARALAGGTIPFEAPPARPPARPPG